MSQAKFTIRESQVEFLNKHSTLGFKDKSEMVRTALDLLKQQIELRKLKESAELYSTEYEKDPDLQELTNLASREWPK